MKQVIETQLLKVPEFKDEFDYVEVGDIRRLQVSADRVPERMAPVKDSDPEMVFAAGLLINHPLITDGSHRLWNADVEGMPEGVYQYKEYSNRTDDPWPEKYLALRVAINKQDQIVVLYNSAHEGGHTFGYYTTEKDSESEIYRPTEEFRWNSNEKRFVSVNEPEDFSGDYDWPEPETAEIYRPDTMVSLAGEPPVSDNSQSTHSAADIRNRALKVAQNWNAGSKEEFDVLSSLDKDRSITAILNAVHTMSCSELTEHDLEAHLANLEIHFTVLTSNEFQNNIREIAFDHLSQYFLGAGLDSSLQEIDQYALRALKGYLDSGKCPLWLQVDIREWFDNHELTNILINF